MLNVGNGDHLEPHSAPGHRKRWPSFWLARKPRDRCWRWQNHLVIATTKFPRHIRPFFVSKLIKNPLQSQDPHVRVQGPNVQARTLLTFDSPVIPPCCLLNIFHVDPMGSCRSDMLVAGRTFAMTFGVTYAVFQNVVCWDWSNCPSLSSGGFWSFRPDALVESLLIWYDINYVGQISE